MQHKFLIYLCWFSTATNKLNFAYLITRNNDFMAPLRNFIISFQRMNSEKVPLPQPSWGDGNIAVDFFIFFFLVRIF